VPAHLSGEVNHAGDFEGVLLFFISSFRALILGDAGLEPEPDRARVIHYIKEVKVLESNA